MTDYRTMGAEAGAAAASWVFDGNTSDETYRTILQGIVDGDPEILDSLAINPLSGEWAGESMPEILGDDYTDEDADEYEEGFQDAYWADVERTARFHLESL